MMRKLCVGLVGHFINQIHEFQENGELHYVLIISILYYVYDIILL
jgi:hypothetical protein